jgi:hypothetical protein
VEIDLPFGESSWTLRKTKTPGDANAIGHADDASANDIAAGTLPDDLYGLGLGVVDKDRENAALETGSGLPSARGTAGEDFVSLATDPIEGGILELDAVSADSSQAPSLASAAGATEADRIREIEERHVDRGLGVFQAFEVAAANVPDTADLGDRRATTDKAASATNEGNHPVQSPAPEKPARRDDRADSNSVRPPVSLMPIAVAQVLGAAAHLEDSNRNEKSEDWLKGILRKSRRPQ